MPLSRRLLPLLGAVLAVVVAGCSTGEVRKPPQPAVVAAAGGGGPQPDTGNPSSALVACLGQRGVHAHVDESSDVVVDPPSAGIHVRFLGTDGDAQAAQLHGDAEGAEVILNAMVFVGNATDAQLQPVESCAAKVAK